MKPYAANVWGLELPAYGALSYQRMGLKLR
jgi:hypothetical protein